MPQVKINRHSRYLDIFISSKCAPDLLSRNLFPNPKEITESYAMFEATRHLPNGFEWNNTQINCVVVGDGRKPRTGAMFAFRTAWNCISVDPDCSNSLWNVNRLSTIRKKIEDVKLSYDSNTLVVMPHSHAPIMECIRNITAPNISIITMDCCVNNRIPNRKPDVEYVDEDVWSPLNTIRIYNLRSEMN